ncbi:LuxR C-terminal-related transcriptional regulator [Gordonia malaquae]|uniref:LuxR C-terminal-related transcriptional regulator n=1 Tax=Gordonia malaquae TaxID=410332 RepID=UPI0030FF0516
MTTASEGVRRHSHRVRPRTGGGQVVRFDDSVGVLSAGAFAAELSASWIRSLGYRSRIVDVAEITECRVLPKVLVVDGAAASTTVPPLLVHLVKVVVVVDVTDLGAVLPGATVVRDAAGAPAAIRSAIADVLGEGRVRVVITPRELEVMAKYVMGATVKETAAAHFVAECTVRTHYRRVTQRYEAAGRPVANKAQLLLAMVADGWLTVDGTVARPAPPDLG